MSCSSDDSSDSGTSATAHTEDLATLTGLLPADTRGVFSVDLASLRSGESSDEVAALLDGDGGQPVLVEEPLAEIGVLTESLDVTDAASSALLVQTTRAADGYVLLAKVDGETLDQVVNGSQPEAAGTHGPESRALYVDGGGHHLALLPDGVLVVGKRGAVTSVVDVSDAEDPARTSPIGPYLDALDGDADLGFVYGLPALLDDEVTPDRSLRGAAVMSGDLDVVDGELEGSIAFHTSNASEFVETYNRLNRYAIEGDEPQETPLTVAEPVADGLPQVVVTLPPSPIDGSPAETVAVCNVAKKLLVGMEAHDYAEDVSSTGNPAWIDLIIKSEADEDTPPVPGAVFFRWAFRDRAAMAAFEANELPPGFTLAPTQFLESDDPEGEYFIALMLYVAGGGSIVDGARAEWDVFVSPPEGADPDAPDRPRYMIIQAQSENVSFDPATLLSEASPVSYELVDDEVVSSVQEQEGDRTVPVFESSFPRPDPDEAEEVRWTTEMAMANDYMHWPNGVYDHIVYNATTYNWEGYFVDTSQTTIDDDSRWAQYLQPELMDATYYVNTLEYVASPLANLDSPFLDVTPEERADLLAFKDNGHQRGIMRGRVEELFLGTGDAYVGLDVPNQTPSTYYSFAITDPEAMEAALDLPDGQRLAPTPLFEDDEEAYHLTLSVHEAADAVEGTRAEWSVYVDDGYGRPRQQVVDLMTEDVGVDPVSIINLPSDVRHGLDDGVLSTHLTSPTISFDASFETSGASDEALSLDWIESGDDICYSNGVCDKFYYDAETLDVPVHQPQEVTVEELSTPWDEFLDAASPTVFYRDNTQGYAVKRWHNLEVEVTVPEIGGLEGATHTISGTGSLVGRESQVADSRYTYTGDAVVDDDRVRFTLDQQVDNALGVSHIYTSGSFDLSTGRGTQTVVDCQGAALMCTDVVAGSEAPYTAQGLDDSDPDAITWRVDVVVDLTNFGKADSSSTFTAAAR
ncbi:MAG: hypothetical protein JNK12_18135 [Acidimicrobiales bacterium]|nr:hypothetical protein [Acidimicrobiales bacterium]